MYKSLTTVSSVVSFVKSIKLVFHRSFKTLICIKMVDNKQSFLSIFEGESIEIIPQDYIENQTVWVFGYGSILWKNGFTYCAKKSGYIQGFVRRFWQGNTTHRGTTNKVSTCTFKTVVWLRRFSGLLVNGPFTQFRVVITTNILKLLHDLFCKCTL